METLRRHSGSLLSHLLYWLFSSAFSGRWLLERWTNWVSLSGRPSQNLTWRNQKVRPSQILFLPSLSFILHLLSAAWGYKLYLAAPCSSKPYEILKRFSGVGKQFSAAEVKQKSLWPRIEALKVSLCLSLHADFLGFPQLPQTNQTWIQNLNAAVLKSKGLR